MYLKILIGLLILLLVVLYFSFRTEPFTDNLKNRFVMYKVDWCPHCRKALPTFNDLKKKFKKAPVSFEVVDCENEGKQICSKEKVNSYPTFKLHTMKGTQEYQSVLTVEGLKDFFSRNV
jgi:thiol-disulfide isomerase/thioredoxin